MKGEIEMAKALRYGELHIIVNNYTGVEGVRLLSATSKTEDVPIQLYARLYPIIQNFRKEVAEHLSKEFDETASRKQEPTTADIKRVGMNAKLKMP